MRPENGGVSVLDFPGQAAMAEVFAKPGSDFARMQEALHLEDGVYRNPYELMTFYDNHDMARLAATEDGFIDANNWLFTARGIPVIYYGSEIGFMARNQASTKATATTSARETSSGRGAIASTPPWPVSRGSAAIRRRFNAACRSSSNSRTTARPS